MLIVTEILLATKGINFIKALYKDGKPAHDARPKGTQIVAEIIAKQIINHDWFNPQSIKPTTIQRVYANNLQNLKFFNNFDILLNQEYIEKSYFKNSLFEEDVYKIRSNYIMNFNFKGRLLGIMLKSDWYDGLFKIKLGQQELITSSFSVFVKEKGTNNINLLSLPFKKSMQCHDFQKLSISVCQNNLDNYELDACKKKPQVSPENWKMSIIGIAYTGQIYALAN
ncbi:MAG: hypothetical protein AAFQ80_08270 [Cyanobacteria bacterium J06621_8]